MTYDQRNLPLRTIARHPLSTLLPLTLRGCGFFLVLSQEGLIYSP